MVGLDHAYPHKTVTGGAEYCHVALCLHQYRLPAQLQSDIVFALALTHHLILSQGISLLVLLNTLSHLTHQYIVIEFMPLGLWDGKNAPPIPDWYNINWFRVHFEKYFMLIVV